MDRVLVTGGAGTIGQAVVRRLFRDPAFEVKVSDQQPAPDWMREGCEVHTGDLRQLAEARSALSRCTHVIHLAALVGDAASAPHTRLEVDNALHNAIFRAALDADVRRLTFVSSCAVFERATQHPTTEAHLPDCPAPHSADGFSKLTGEAYCRTANAEHGLRFTICRPCHAYAGTGDGLVGRTLRKALRGAPMPYGDSRLTPTHVDDVASGLVLATAAARALNDDFNLAAGEEVTVSELAELCWEAAGRDPDERVVADELELGYCCPSVEKARAVLDWQARIPIREGIHRAAGRLRTQEGIAA